MLWNAHWGTDLKRWLLVRNQRQSPTGLGGFAVQAYTSLSEWGVLTEKLPKFLIDSFLLKSYSSKDEVENLSSGLRGIQKSTLPPYRPWSSNNTSHHGSGGGHFRLTWRTRWRSDSLHLQHTQILICTPRCVWKCTCILRTLPRGPSPSYLEAKLRFSYNFLR